MLSALPNRALALILAAPVRPWNASGVAASTHSKTIARIQVTARELEMRMPARIVIASVLVVAGLGAAVYWGTQRIFVKALAETEVSVPPYVAEQVQFYLKDGKEIVTSNQTMARRRDGAVRITATISNPNGTDRTGMSRIELPDGETAMVIDSIRAKSTGRRPSEAVAARKNALLSTPPQCLLPATGGSNPEVVDGEDTMYGVQAIRLVRQSAGSTERMVSWRLPDFECAEVQTFKQTANAATGDWETIQGVRLTGFVATDPDPNIFTNWQNYAEMTPSDLKRAFFRARGVTAAQCAKCYSDETKADATYDQWNAQ